jgi:hypothetical protein
VIYVSAHLAFAVFARVGKTVVLDTEARLCLSAGDCEADDSDNRNDQSWRLLGRDRLSHERYNEATESIFIIEQLLLTIRRFRFPHSLDVTPVTHVKSSDSEEYREWTLYTKWGDEVCSGQDIACCIFVGSWILEDRVCYTTDHHHKKICI